MSTAHSASFIQRPEGAYVLGIPANMTISIRGLELMIRDFTREQEQSPSGLLMYQACFRRLCVEAARNAGMLADDTNSDVPRFNGIPITFSDPGRMDNTALLDSY
jgi:hypothetical protein